MSDLGSDDGERDETPALSPEAAAAAALFSDWMDAWFASLRATYDRARDPDSGYGAEENSSEATELLELYAPLVERSIDLMLTYLRPWSEAFVTRSGATPDE